MERHLSAIAALLAALLMAGCDSGRTDPPNSSMLVINADPALGDVVFRRVRANATTLAYKAASGFSFDVDTYTFSFDVLAPDGSIQQTISTVQTLEEGTDLILVLRDVAGQPTAQVITSPVRGASASGTQIQLLHTASVVATVDIFIEPEGFDLAAATPKGTLAAGDVLVPAEFAAGSYEFVVTEANNRANVLLRSTPVALGGTQDAFMLIADGANEGLAPFSIVLAGTDPVELVDTGIQSGIRVLNGVSDRSAIDAGLDMALTPPLIPNVAFASVIDPVPIDSGNYNFNVTPAGNPGVIEIDQEFTTVRGALGTWFVSGSPGSLRASLFGDDFRVIPGESKLRIFNASPLAGTAQIFLLPPGTALAGATPVAVVGDGSATENHRIAPGDYELTIRDDDNVTVLFGPTPVTISADGYYALLLADAAGGSTVDVEFLYDFN